MQTYSKKQPVTCPLERPTRTVRGGVGEGGGGEKKKKRKKKSSKKKKKEKEKKKGTTVYSTTLQIKHVKQQ